MKRILLTFITVFFFQSLTLAQSSSSIARLSERADSLFERFDEVNALKAYEQMLEQHPDRFEALWKASFLYSRVGYRLEEEDDQKEYYNKAKALAEQALKVDSTDTQAHFAMAVAMGRMAQVSGPRDRVSASKVIKEHVDRSIEADSTNSGAWHVLGLWHFKVANLNFMERLAANALYGGVPRDASNESSEQAIERAIELNPKYPLYYYDLARVYDERGKEEQAIQACKEALKLESVGPDDDQVKENCRGLIHELQ